MVNLITFEVRHDLLSYAHVDQNRRVMIMHWLYELSVGSS
jgi:hypothetical protein